MLQIFSQKKLLYYYLPKSGVRKSNLFVAAGGGPSSISHCLWISGLYRGNSGAHLFTHFFLCVTVAHFPGSSTALQIISLKGLQISSFSGRITHSLIFRVKFLQFHIFSWNGYWDKNDIEICYFSPRIYTICSCITFFKSTQGVTYLELNVDFEKVIELHFEM